MNGLTGHPKSSGGHLMGYTLIAAALCLVLLAMIPLVIGPMGRAVTLVSLALAGN